MCYFFWPSDLTCKVNISVTGLSDAFLLLNSFFSLVDRYVAIGYPLWHRSNMTMPLVISVILFGNVLQAFILKFMYIAKLFPLRFQMRPVEGKLYLGSLTLLFVLCFLARVTVYFQTKRILSESRPPSVDGDLAERVVCNRSKDPGIKASVRIQLGPRISQNMLNRLEIEATRVLVIGVTSLLLTSSPLVVFLIGLTVCYDTSSSIEYCNETFGWLIPYLMQFGLIHSVYHPIVHMIWSKELYSTKQICRCFSCQHSL